MGIERRTPAASSPRLTVARLAGTSGRLAHAGTPADEAAAELRAITTDPVLLGKAAGAEKACAAVDPIMYPWAAVKAEYLITAGADAETTAVVAGETTYRLMVDRLGHRSPT